MSKSKAMGQSGSLRTQIKSKPVDSPPKQQTKEEIESKNKEIKVKCNAW